MAAPPSCCQHRCTHDGKVSEPFLLEVLSNPLAIHKKRSYSVAGKRDCRVSSCCNNTGMGVCSSAWAHNACRLFRVKQHKGDRSNANQAMRSPGCTRARHSWIRYCTAGRDHSEPYTT